MTKQKKKFFVGENETIHECLARMEREGFRPVRRLEQPVFIEEKTNGKTEYKPILKKIIFEGEKMP
ncbi:NETI motif-containing protein [Siminovitchia sp. 179-K 8D1 HS]|uniref:NETI motif-containing protein n=1 Tax=Siminovitchia sp. 179-K 8D1 HS TaxID=3142385 RepID=UPI0039A07EA8